AAEDVHSNVELLQASAIVHLADGDTQTAIQQLEKAQAMMKAKGLQQEYVVSALPWLATARRIALEKHGGYVPSINPRSLAEAMRTARQALKLAQKYRNNLPH